ALTPARTRRSRAQRTQRGAFPDGSLVDPLDIPRPGFVPERAAQQQCSRPLGDDLYPGPGPPDPAPGSRLPPGLVDRPRTRPAEKRAAPPTHLDDGGPITEQTPWRHPDEAPDPGTQQDSPGQRDPRRDGGPG